MIFQHTIDLVLSGKKTETSRIIQPGDKAIKEALDTIMAISSVSQGYPNGRLKWMVGQTYAVQRGRGQKAEGRIRLKAIRESDRRDITPAGAGYEGFDSVFDFLELWCQMHDPDAMELFDYYDCNSNTRIVHQLKARPDEHYQAWVLTFELVD